MKRTRRSSVHTATVLAVVVCAGLCLGAARTSATESPALLRICSNLFGAAVVSESTCVVVGDRGRILITQDGGKAWTTALSGTRRALAAVCFAGGRDGWSVGQGGTILHSADSGGTWRPQSSGVNAYLLDVDFSDPRHGFAVGADGVVLATADGGRIWNRCPFQPPETLGEAFNLLAVAVISPEEACIGGDAGRIFRTADHGLTWREVRSPLYDPDTMEGRALYDMACDGSAVYGVGVDGALVVSNDRGRTWTEGRTAFQGPELFCIDMVGGVGLAAGSGGIVLETSDSGSTWRMLPVPDRITRAWLSGLNLMRTPSGRIVGLIAGRNGAIGRFEAGRLTWWKPAGDIDTGTGGAGSW